jgi:hypothetical protein
MVRMLEIFHSDKPRICLHISLDRNVYFELVSSILHEARHFKTIESVKTTPGYRFIFQQPSQHQSRLLDPYYIEDLELG